MSAPNASPFLVLLVGPTTSQRSKLRHALLRHGYEVAIASTCREAVDVLHRREGVALVLIQGGAGAGSIDLRQEIKAIRRSERDVPIVMIADHFDATQVVDLLNAGAHDCIAGPHLEYRVLLARLDAALRASRVRSSRQSAEDSSAVIRVGGVTIDPTKFRAYVGDQPCDLTRIQFQLLYALARRSGQVFSHAQLRNVIANCGGNLDEKSVKSHIYHLRRRLGRGATLIRTVRGLGYQLVESGGPSADQSVV